MWNDPNRADGVIGHERKGAFLSVSAPGQNSMSRAVTDRPRSGAVAPNLALNSDRLIGRGRLGTGGAGRGAPRATFIGVAKVDNGWVARASPGVELSFNI